MTTLNGLTGGDTNARPLNALSESRPENRFFYNEDPLANATQAFSGFLGQALNKFSQKVASDRQVLKPFAERPRMMEREQAAESSDRNNTAVSNEPRSERAVERRNNETDTESTPREINSTEEPESQPLNRTQDESPEAKTSTARPESTESEDGVNRAQEESTEAGTASQETDQTAPQQAAAQAGAATATRELPIQALPLVSQLNQQTETAAAPEQTVLPETQSTAPTELITSQETRLPSAGAAETANADTVPELSQAFQQQLEQITQAGENSDKGPGPAPQAALAKELGNLHPHLNPHLPEHKGPVMAPHAHIQLQSQQESELASLTLNPALIPQEPIAGNGESLRKAGEPAGILQPALGSAVGADLPKVQVNLEGAAGQFAGGFQNQQSNGSEMNFNQQDLSGVEVTIHGVGGVSEVKTTGQVTSTLSPALTKATGETVADQAVSGAQMAMAAGKKEISLNLNPENLGQLRIHLTSNGDQQVSARFVTTTLEARDQLQEQIDALRQSMEKQGIQVGQITVVMAGEESASANNKGQDAAARQNQQQQADPFQQMSQQNGSHQYQQAGRDNGGGWNQSATSSSPSGGESGAFGLNGVDSSTENGSTDGSRSTSHDNGRISLLI